MSRICDRCSKEKVAGNIREYCYECIEDLSIDCYPSTNSSSPFNSISKEEIILSNELLEKLGDDYLTLLSEEDKKEMPFIKYVNSYLRVKNG